jgi:hypothetical protein
VADRPTRDATFVLRVWVEDGDPTPRGRLIEVMTGDEVVARGIDEILAATADWLRRFEEPSAGVTPL